METTDHDSPAEAVAAAEEVEGERDDLEITISEGFEQWLAEQGASLVFAIPPAKLFLVGLDDEGELSVFERTFNKTMGIAHFETQTLHLGTRIHLSRLENLLPPGQLTDDGYDRLFVPLHSSATGYLSTHDLGVEGDGSVLIVNTRFGCLAAPSDAHSFRPVCWPPFLPGPWPNDRCHLNGLAMRDGRAAYVTSVSTTAGIDSWRDHRRAGGAVTDVESGEIVCTGLSMPHSPRWYRDRLWVANAAGRGRSARRVTRQPVRRRRRPRRLAVAATRARPSAPACKPPAA